MLNGSKERETKLHQSHIRDESFSWRSEQSREPENSRIGQTGRGIVEILLKKEQNTETMGVTTLSLNLPFTIPLALRT
jgi:hypothetical protein